MSYPAYVDNGGIFAEGDYSVTCDYPATVNLNDICIAQLGDADNDSFTEPTGDGWNKVDEETANANWSTTWMWKRCDGTEGGTTQTFTTQLLAGQGVYGVISRYSGCITTGNPYEANTKTTVSQETTSTVSSITVGTERLVLCLLNVEDDVSIGDVTDFTEAYYLTSTFGGDAALKVIYQQKSDGTTTERTSSLGGNEYQNTYTFALIPPAAGWTGKINGTTNPSKINNVSVSGISKVNGV